MKYFVLSLFSLAFGSALSAQPQKSLPDPLKVLCSNGVGEVMKELQPQIEKAIGRKIAFEFGTATGYKQKIDGGEEFDVAILTPVLIDDLIRQGKVDKGSFDIAQGGVGVGVRAGAPKPKIDSMAEFKAAMLLAKSVTLTGNGQSRTTVDAAFDRLGIADVMKSKTLLVGPGEGPPNVAAGKAEIVLTLISEIIAVKGVQLVGPLPAELQKYSTFTAGASETSKNAASARAFVDFLRHAKLDRLLEKYGMKPILRALVLREQVCDGQLNAIILRFQNAIEGFEMPLMGNPPSPPRRGI